jgi:hypothetical protein
LIQSKENALQSKVVEITFYKISNCFGTSQTALNVDIFVLKSVVTLVQVFFFGFRKIGLI